MSTGQTQKTKERVNMLKGMVDNAKKYEDQKDYATLKMAQYLSDIKDNDAQTAVGFPVGIEGFKRFCGEHMNTGYQTAQRYIAIHKMVIACAIDPAEAEDLGYSKLRTIASVARPDNINLLMEQAKSLNTHDLEAYVKNYKEQAAGAGAPSDKGSGELIIVKRFTFPASDEEVQIINTTLLDVKQLIGTQNDTAALIHILQSYMQFAYPAEREQALTEKSKAADFMAEKVTGKVKTKKADPTPEVETTPEVDTDIIDAVDVPGATLPQLLAFAKAHGIKIGSSIASNKPKVKSTIIEALSVKDEEEHTSSEELIETPSTSEPEVSKDKKGKEKPVKTPKAGKKTETKKEVTPEPEAVADPADTEGELPEITREEAIAEIRGVADKKELKAIAKSWGIVISADDYKKVDIETLIETVVKAVCEANQVEYIPPTPVEDNSDLDAMLKGE